MSRNLAKGAKPPPISTVMELILGAVAGALGQIFTIPVSVIATRQQVGLVKSKSQPVSSPSEAAPKQSPRVTSNDQNPARSTPKDTYDNSFLSVARVIIREDGVTGLWLGLKPSLVLTVNPAITYGVFERVKSLILIAKEKTGGNGKLTPWQSFFVGAVSKTLATIVRV